MGSGRHITAWVCSVAICALVLGSATLMAAPPVAITSAKLTGSTLTIKGLNFGTFSATKSKVTFNNVLQTTNLVWTDTQISVDIVVPPSGTYLLTVAKDNG